MPTFTIFCCIAKNKDKTNAKSPTPREKFNILGYQPVLEDVDRKLITVSGHIIFQQKHLETKAVSFLIEFFKSYPQHQKYFKAFRDTPYQELTTLPVAENHGRKVMDQVKVLVDNVNDPVKMKEILYDLAFSHHMRRVRITHIKDMLFTFVEFVKMELDDQFTNDMEVAWKKFVAFIMAVVEDEGSKANILPKESLEMTPSDQSLTENTTRV